MIGRQDIHFISLAQKYTSDDTSLNVAFCSVQWCFFLIYNEIEMYIQYMKMQGLNALSVSQHESQLQTKLLLLNDFIRRS